MIWLISDTCLRSVSKPNDFHTGRSANGIECLWWDVWLIPEQSLRVHIVTCESKQIQKWPFRRVSLNGSIKIICDYQMGLNTIWSDWSVLIYRSVSFKGLIDNNNFAFGKGSLRDQSHCFRHIIMKQHNDIISCLQHYYNHIKNYVK